MKHKNRLFDLICNHHWLVLLASTVLVGFAASGLGQLTVDVSLETLMDKDYPPFVRHKEIQREYTYSSNVIFVIYKPPTEAQPRDTIFNRQTLSVIQQLTEQAWQIPYINRVNSLSNYQHTQAVADDLQVEALIYPDTVIDESVINKVKQVALTEPSLHKILVADSGNLTLISMDFSVSDDVGRGEITAEIFDVVEQILQPHRDANPDLTIAISGSLTFEHASGKYAYEDGASLVPLMLLLMVVVLALLLRSVWATAAAVLMIVSTGAASMGTVGWLGVKLDVATFISPIIIMTLAVADAIHVIVGMSSGMQRGMNRRDAIRDSLNINIWPVFLTSVTTMLGVVTFAFSDYPALRKLGIIISLGVGTAFILTVTMLPALLAIFPVHFKERAQNKSSLLNYFVEGIIRYHRIVLAPAVILCAILVALSSQNLIDDSSAKIFRPGTPEHAANQLINQEIGGSERIDVAITGAEGVVTEPEFLQVVDDFSNWLKGQDSVQAVNTVSDTFKRLNRSMHGDHDDWYRLPESRELASQYLLLYELSLPYGMDLTNQINLDRSGTRLFITTSDVYAGELLAMRRNSVAWLKDRDPTLEIDFSGLSFVIPELAITRMMAGFLQGGMLAIAMVSLVLFIVLRQWRYGLIGMLANVVPVAMGYGIWSQINGIANYAVMSVAGVCLGVVVDFAVHFLSKYRSARSRGLDAENAVRYAFEKVGMPLITTAIVLVSGFWLLVLSPIQLNASMGLLTGIIILLALAFDFIIMPSLLLLFDRKKIPATGPAKNDSQNTGNLSVEANS